jgi:superfamily II DNA helicase RecQ
VPPYVILHDKTLAAICEHRPESIEALASIPGIGARKLELYGDDLIRITGEHPAEEAGAEVLPA